MRLIFFYLVFLRKLTQMRTDKGKDVLWQQFQIHFSLETKPKVTNASLNGKGRDPIIHLYLQLQRNDAERKMG